MRDPIPRGPFDQGLFLAHFNKGRDLYEGRKYEEAERELEEAYLLRPRDNKVLNLLGLVYFKQEKLEKAEEVYRKLVAESPEAHTLYYNLGLIYFKLNRLEDAESAFLKAIELSNENPKINFYLGSIYERLHRFTDAIFQYRQAGASLMVRRVEGKIAATGPGPVPAPPPAHATPPPPRRDETAELPKDEIQAHVRKLEEEAAIALSKILQPAPTLVPEGTRPPSSTDTARFRKPREETRPPAGDGSRLDLEVPDTIPPGTLKAPSAAAPPRPRVTELFRFLHNNLMEIDFSGKVFIKQGTIYSYSGKLTFLVKEKRPGGQPALVIVVGAGKLILSDRDRQITFMHVEEEGMHVEPSHLLACEDSLTPHYQPLEGSPLEFIALDGRGMVALSAATKPLTIAVTPGLPVSVPSSSVITWSGDLTPRVVDDKQVYEVMLAPGRDGGSLIRFEGAGRILVEQACTGVAPRS
jgi:tetratricopeptide (TPR) repeat protein